MSRLYIALYDCVCDMDNESAIKTVIIIVIIGFKPRKF